MINQTSRGCNKDVDSTLASENNRGVDVSHENGLLMRKRVLSSRGCNLQIRAFNKCLECFLDLDAEITRWKDDECTKTSDNTL